MENATKALMIAAAILVAIIIISLGLNVVRQGQEAVQSADMSAAEIEAYNSQFTAYEGTNRSTADVNALLGKVLSHNQTQAQQNTGRSVTVSCANGGAVNNNSITRVTGSSRYTITCTLTNGLVTAITITDNAATN